MMDYLRLFDEVKQSLIVAEKYYKNKENFHKWVEAHINYHLRSLSGCSDEEEFSVYSRHLRLIQKGYQNFDDGVRSQNKEISFDTMLRHSGLVY
jgi:hypothetical protein